MTIHEFQNLLEVETPLGRGIALLMESKDHDHFWTVVLNETRAIVKFRQYQIRATRNYSQGWGMDDNDMLKVLEPLKKRNASS